ncbi:MAG: M20/M25/M40 family metallo-hydrolase [Gemmatimonadaceae bacterium]|nr:M20/M25/M40 family metallo-hydrolase [Gemmatimonadaceae bacterium]
MKGRALLAVVAAAAFAAPANAQTFPTNDATLRRIWEIGMQQSQVYPLLQVLLDSIGPRLTATPEHRAGNDWLVKTYASWGIPAQVVNYGTWKGWRRGISHVDLVAPRVRSLEGMILAWSPGTPNGRPVQGEVVILPDVADSAAFVRWLPNARGKFVMVNMAQPTCRPDENWQRWATEESYNAMRARRDTATRAWNARVQRTGQALSLGTGTLGRRLEQAGAAGVIQSRWSQGWGVNKIFDSKNIQNTPSIDLSCEDYGMVFRLAEHNQGPVLRVTAEASFTGEVPVGNAIAEIRGREKPSEYVVLSSHFDSWDGSQGATDNGTGTVVMLEAMRILRQAYPNPKRTIISGHWAGEEQGLIGSRAFAADRPEVVSGLQALFNQDNGTGRVVNLSSSGLTRAAGNYAGWIAQLPEQLTRHFTGIAFPGQPGGGGSDFASFLCYGAPAFSLGSLGYDYGTYTWHTNRDSFDKINFDDVRSNAVLTAMLVYLASEDPETVPRDRRVIINRDGSTGEWPACATPARRSAEWTR